MARPKKGQPGYEAATKKWRETMLEKYGKDGTKAFFSEIGKRGGANGWTGGFYANRELAKKMGAIGGKKSKRKGTDNYNEVWNRNCEEIIKMYESGVPMTDISKKYKISYSALRMRIKKETK